MFATSPHFTPELARIYHELPSPAAKAAAFHLNSRSVTLSLLLRIPLFVTSHCCMAPASLDRIFQQASSSSSKSNGPPASHSTEDDPVVKELPGGYKKLASGVVLDKDGKPCRQCTSSMAWMSMMKSTKPASTPATTTAASTTLSGVSSATECPPDVEDLGRSTWTMLHAMAASYPEICVDFDAIYDEAIHLDVLPAISLWLVRNGLPRLDEGAWQ